MTNDADGIVLRKCAIIKTIDYIFCKLFESNIISNLICINVYINIGPTSKNQLQLFIYCNQC